MHPHLVDAFVEQVRKRVSEGDCPVTPRLHPDNVEPVIMALADRAELRPPEPSQDDADLGDLTKHAMNCGWYGSYGDADCTCSLKLRVALSTERTMHRAWRKRAEEAEATSPTPSPDDAAVLDATAVIKDGKITISLDVDILDSAIEQLWSCGRYNWPRYKVTDKAAFANEFVAELNREQEDGTTPIHLLFDNAAMKAIENGALGVEEHEDQEH